MEPEREQIILTTDWHKFRIKYNTSRNLIEEKKRTHKKNTDKSIIVSQSKSKKYDDKLYCNSFARSKKAHYTV